MSNSIRTPRQGATAHSRRIAQAVDNEEWQEFRLSLKGIPTCKKLEYLQAYWYNNYRDHTSPGHQSMLVDIDDCDICIRIDNYIKALCRGGQLEPYLGVSWFVNCGNRDWPGAFTYATVEGLRRRISVIRK